MARGRTASFAAQADANWNAPIILVRLYLPGLTKYLTTLAGSWGGQSYDEILQAGVALSVSMDALGRLSRNSGGLAILNGPDANGVRFSDLFAGYAFQNQEAQVDLLFDGLNLGDALRLFKGTIDLPPDNLFDDRVVSLNLLDDGQTKLPAPGIAPDPRVHQLLGTLVDAATWPSADPDALGQMEPIVYGTVEQLVCLPVATGGRDRLAADAAAGATALVLSDPKRFAVFPASGTVQVETEQVAYASKTAATLTLNLSAPLALMHASGREATEVRGTYDYLVAAHPCKAVRTVLGDGAAANAAYTTDLSGPTLIKFTARPSRQLAVAVASLGSHTHGGTQVHEYPTTPSLPFACGPTGFDTKAVTFANTPAAGTTTPIHIRVSAVSMKSNDVFQFRRGGSPLIDNIKAPGDYYVTDPAPGTSYDFHLQGTAFSTCTVTMIERDVTTAGANSSAALGVAASPAEIVLAKTITCDVDGCGDDDRGTYTGAPGGLVTNPADVIKHIFGSLLSLSPGGWVDAGSFDQARFDFAAAGIRCDFAVTAQVSSAELLERLRSCVAARLYQSMDGRFKLFVLPPGGALVKTLVEADDMRLPASYGLTPLTDLYNIVSMQYKPDSGTSGYLALALVADEASKATYRTNNTLNIDNPFVRDAGAAAAVAAKLLAWHKDQKKTLKVTAPGIPNLHLELLDKVGITCDRMPGGGWIAKPFYVVGVQQTIGGPNQPATVVLALREA
jgi:hypothetical protein